MKRCSLLLAVCLCAYGWAYEGSLTLSYLEGEVEVLRKGEVEWKRAELYSALYPGDRIRTKLASKCELKFADDSIIRMDENTLFDVEELIREKEKDTSFFKIWWGKIKARIKRLRTKDSSLSFYTPTAVMGLRGTIIEIAVDRKTGKTRLKVLKGKMFFRPIKAVEEIGVEENEFVETEDGLTYTKGEVEEKEAEEVMKEIEKGVVDLLKDRVKRESKNLEGWLNRLRKDEIQREVLDELARIESLLEKIKDRADRAETEKELLLLIEKCERVRQMLKMVERIPKEVLPLKMDHKWLTQERFVNFIPTLLLRVTPDDKPVVLSVDKKEFRFSKPPYILRYRPFDLSTGINEVKVAARYADGSGMVSLVIKTPYYDRIKPMILPPQVLNGVIEVQAIDRESGIFRVLLNRKRMVEVRKGVYQIEAPEADRAIIEAEDRAHNVTRMPITLKIEDWPPGPPKR